MYNFIHYPSDIAAILESGFSPTTLSSKCSFFNSSELKSFSGLTMPCSVDEQTPMAKASVIVELLSARTIGWWRPFPVVTRWLHQASRPIDIMDLHKWLFWAAYKMIILKKEKIISQQNNANNNFTLHIIQTFSLVKYLWTCYWLKPNILKYICTEPDLWPETRISSNGLVFSSVLNPVKILHSQSPRHNVSLPINSPVCNSVKGKKHYEMKILLVSLRFFHPQAFYVWKVLSLL